MKFVAPLTAVLMAVLTAPHVSYGEAAISRTTQSCGQGQCYCGIPDPWAGYCQEKRGHKSSCGCGILRGGRFRSSGSCGETGCTSCQSHGPHIALRPISQHGAVAGSPVRSGHDGHSSSQGVGDGHHGQRVRNFVPEPQPSSTTLRSAPHNSLPIASSRPISDSHRAVGNHLPTNSEGAHHRAASADQHGHVAADEGHVHGAASESKGLCQGNCGANLFFHFLDKLRPTGGCSDCKDHS